MPDFQAELKEVREISHPVGIEGVSSLQILSLTGVRGNPQFLLSTGKP
jgi:hypothetical protein